MTIGLNKNQLEVQAGGRRVGYMFTLQGGLCTLVNYTLLQLIVSCGSS